MNAVNQDVLRRYLLGAADAASSSEIEQRLFSDDRVFWERLAIAEDELIDDYAKDALDGDDQALFESRFLVTDERRARLAFARAFCDYAREHPAGRVGVRDWLRAPSSVPRWALAAAALLLMTIVPIAVLRVGSGGRAPAAFAVSLVPGVLRDAGTEVATIEVASGCQLVHLDLLAAANPYPAYSATVHDGNGMAIWSQHRLVGVPRDGSVAFRLTVPCDLLPEDDYWVRLSGLRPGEEPDPLDRYDFRILRR